MQRENWIGGFATLADTRVYYEIYGQGAPVLLFHGNGEDLHAFDSMIPVLAKSRRVIAVDTRAHGKSGRGTQPFDFHTFAADAATVMDQLGIRRTCVVGYSDGGSTAMHLALAHPEKVAGLALLGANLSPKGVTARFQAPIVLGYAACRALARFDKGAAAKREVLELMVRHPSLTEGQVARIVCPALVMAGEKDIIKQEHTAAIAAAIPNARLEILSGETHFSLVKSPRAAQLIDEFLGGIRE